MPTQNLKQGHHIHGFDIARAEAIPELRSEATVFTHAKTGARLVHVYNDDPNNMFAIAFRTPVADDTGVPHFLEHSVLCGSRKFPIKDPFQELLKGSLQTFLNALTYPDKTVYPVSSQVERDFYNLVDVYCDAVFHPRLTQNTFFQEGWHFDVEGEAPIDIKGIVYNEMKGVYSDFSSFAARKTMSAIFPDTTYFFESGGDPRHIPDLTYEGLRSFHAKYYHPSNSFIFLYGNLPAEKTLKFLDENYLREFDRITVESTVHSQPLWNEPRSIDIEAPASREDDGTASVVTGWIWGDATEPLMVLAGQVLFRYLLGTESSPLRRALIDSGLGEDLDDLTGLDTDLIQCTFAAGLRKTRPERQQEVIRLIHETLSGLVDKGLDDDLLEGCLRQVEFKLREVGGGARFPYGLMLADRCFRSWIYGGDPLAHLKFEEPLNRLKAEKVRGQEFFIRLIRERLLKNRHQLVAVVRASSTLAETLNQQTDEHVKELTKDFSAQDRGALADLTKGLLKEQRRGNTPEALASLPRLTVADLPREGQRVPTESHDADGVVIHAHPLFTAGIVYLDIGFDFSELSSDLAPYLPLYSDLIARCGAARLSYEEMSRRIGLATGGVRGSILCQASVGDSDRIVRRFFLHAKALHDRVGDMLGIVKDLLLEPNLGDVKQIRDLLLEMRNDLKSAVVGSGHGFAMTHAAAQLCATGSLNETLSGIAQLRFLDKLASLETVDAVAAKLRAIHAGLISRHGLVISLTADAPGAHVGVCRDLVRQLPAAELRTVATPFSPSTQDPCGIEIPAAVNFVAKAWLVERMGADRIGQLFLLARHLSTGFLWDKVRVEGGAYGGNASFGSTEPVFFCSSYRDPNLARTLDIFGKAVDGLRDGATAEALEQSIIGAIGKIDAPRTPHDKGFSETVALLGGRTPEFRQSVREAVMNASVKELVQAAEETFGAGLTAVTVLGGASALDEAEKSGLRMRREALVG